MSVHKRLIAAVIVDGGMIVNRYQFRKSLPVGLPRYTMEALERWQLDEVCVLDISGHSLSARGIRETERLVCSFSGRTPLAIGGGISSAADAKLVIRTGAERVVLGGAAFARPALVRDVSEEVGEQAVVLSVPFFLEGTELFWSMPRGESRRPLADLLRLVGESFRGELLLQSMAQDGKTSGTSVSHFHSALHQVEPLRCMIMGGLATPRLVESALSLPQVSGVCIGNRMHAEELLSPRLKRTIDFPMRPYQASDAL